MASKSRNPVKKLNKTRIKPKKTLKTEEEHLELMIFFTERAVNRLGGRKDPGMVAQVERLRDELKARKS